MSNRPVSLASPIQKNPTCLAQLRVEYWPVERLKPYERNPRKNDKAVEQIRASIREFGFAGSSAYLPCCLLQVLFQATFCNRLQ